MEEAVEEFPHLPLVGMREVEDADMIVSLATVVVSVIVMTRIGVAVEVLQVGVIAIKLVSVTAAGVVVLKGMIVVLDVNFVQRAVFLRWG